MTFPWAPKTPSKVWKGGYALPPGSGPIGESCGTCSHLTKDMTTNGTSAPIPPPHYSNYISGWMSWVWWLDYQPAN